MLVLTVAGGLSMGAALWSGSAHAQDSPGEARHAAMEAIQGAMGQVRPIAMGEAPFDAAVVKQSGETILAKLKAAAELFPEGSAGGRAKAEIWSDRAGFEEAMAASQKAAADLAAVTEAGGLEAAMRGLGGSCRGCHSKYRAPEQ